MKRRHGFTLIEMLLTMTVGSVLMVLGMSLLQQAMTLSSQASNHRDFDSAANRLCDQFRSDVRDATIASVGQDQTLSMELAEHEVQYNFGNHRVTRSRTIHARAVDAADSDQTASHETYDVGPSSELSVEILESPRRIVLVIRRSSSLKHLPSRVDRHVSAVVGRRGIVDPETEKRP